MRKILAVILFSLAIPTFAQEVIDTPVLTSNEMMLLGVVIGLLVIMAVMLFVIYKLAQANGVNVSPEAVKDIMNPMIDLLDKSLERFQANAALTPDKRDDMLGTAGRVGLDIGKNILAASGLLDPHNDQE